MWGMFQWGSVSGCDLGWFRIRAVMQFLGCQQMHLSLSGTVALNMCHSSFSGCKAGFIIWLSLPDLGQPSAVWPGNAVFLLPKDYFSWLRC